MPPYHLHKSHFDNYQTQTLILEVTGYNSFQNIFYLTNTRFWILQKRKDIWYLWLITKTNFGGTKKKNPIETHEIAIVAILWSGPDKNKINKDTFERSEDIQNALFCWK